ncbi:hypothetical protein pb186bvf_012597 [Paramecium bursaria]
MQTCQECGLIADVFVCKKCPYYICEDCLEAQSQNQQFFCPNCQILTQFNRLNIVEICEACADIHQNEKEQIQCLKLTLAKLQGKFQIVLEMQKNIIQLKQKVAENEKELALLSA